MFGEKPIFLQKEIAIDKKGRIVLPKNTGAEHNDELVMTFSEEKDCCQMFLNSQIIEKINILLDKQMNASDINIFYELRQRINDIHKYCVDVSHVDDQNRVLIPRLIREELELKDSVYIFGTTELLLPCLKVYKNKNDMYK